MIRKRSEGQEKPNKGGEARRVCSGEGAAVRCLPGFSSWAGRTGPALRSINSPAFLSCVASGLKRFLFLKQTNKKA